MLSASARSRSRISRLLSTAPPVSRNQARARADRRERVDNQGEQVAQTLLLHLEVAAELEQPIDAGRVVGRREPEGVIRELGAA